SRAGAAPGPACAWGKSSCEILCLVQENYPGPHLELSDSIVGASLELARSEQVPNLLPRFVRRLIAGCSRAALPGEYRTAGAPASVPGLLASGGRSEQK